MSTEIQLSFNYESLPVEYRVEAQTTTAEIKILGGQAGQTIIGIGQRLIRMKEILGHGNWLPWLKAEFGGSEAGAKRFMRVATEFKSLKLSDLSIAPSALYLLAAPSTPDEAREDAIGIAAQTGQLVSHQTAQELRNAHVQIETLTKQIQAIEGTTEDLTNRLEKKDDILKARQETVRRLTQKYENLQKKMLESQPQPMKRYKTIIVDPPWPIKKILRDERPAQAEWDYPKMTVEEIIALPIEPIVDDDGCHLYLWTTQKYLPDAINIVRVWGFKYQCILTWRKNVGMTPYSWMYSTEHVVFARKGNLDLLKKGVRLDFEGQVREHSRKPDEFYGIVREVSPEPRIDYFSREKREGFDSYGNETTKFRD